MEPLTTSSWAENGHFWDNLVRAKIGRSATSFCKNKSYEQRKTYCVLRLLRRSSLIIIDEALEDVSWDHSSICRIGRHDDVGSPQPQKWQFSGSEAIDAIFGMLKPAEKIEYRGCLQATLCTGFLWSVLLISNYVLPQKHGYPSFAPMSGL